MASYLLVFFGTWSVFLILLAYFIGDTMLKYNYQLIITILFLAFSFSASPLLRADQTSMNLFLNVSPQSHASSASTLEQTTTIRSRPVAIDWLALEEEIRTPGSQATIRQNITLNLFPDVIIDARIDRAVTRSITQYTWFGKPVGVEQGQVILVIDGNRISGNILIDNAFYQIRPTSDDTHIIKEIDQSRFPDEAHFIQEINEGRFSDGEHSSENSSQFGSPSSLALTDSEIESDDGSQIDVLVLYSDDVRAQLGAANVSSLIQLAIDETNTSFINSGVSPRFRLVGQSEVAYNETGNLCGVGTDDLEQLANPADGVIDNIHALRDTYNADLVSLLVKNGGGFCGCAYRLTNASGSPNFAFGVVQYDCATGNYSFGHEAGHNMSAHHDRYVTGNDSTLFNYGFGYVDVSNGWRTVMAYNAECSDQGTFCQRLPYWSNPNVTFGGNPMGIAAGPDAAHNARTLNEIALVISNYRSSTVTTTPDLVVTNPSASTSDLTPGQSFTVTATVKNQGDGASGSTTLRYYRSTDATISSTDTSLGTDPVSGLSPNDTSLENLSTTAPSSPGTYWIGACVDSVSGESNTGNNCSAGVQITVNSVTNPDLVVIAPSVSNTSPTPGQSFTVNATVKNQGDGASGGTTLRYYRSTDATISS
ncbi:MAG: CARDB domain-containing protein, partial [Candidatus Competibacteraceae bacterium]|nr:CARDB domain-containing protein [Candidatus Competibacteraceae bacterium]